MLTSKVVFHLIVAFIDNGAKTACGLCVIEGQALPRITDDPSHHSMCKNCRRTSSLKERLEDL